MSVFLGGGVGVKPDFLPRFACSERETMLSFYRGGVGGVGGKTDLFPRFECLEGGNDFRFFGG